jgi:dipeptidyl aminopeptidase/acylaminoacyl peptidase
VRRRFAGAILLFSSLTLCAGANAQESLTVAEKSNYQETSRYAAVMDFCRRLAKDSPVVRLGALGKSSEGRELPLLILADPPVSTPEQAARSGKLVVFAMGDIHAGEVDGKEALLMLARDLATAKERPLLKDLVLVFAPIFNADGNERLKNNRPRQAGPPLVGTRANAQGFDLNRDFIKLESPEVRALVRFLNRWDPAVVIDCHTTNGSYHRYTLTYEGGGCPAGDATVIRYVRDTLLPDVGKRLKKATGYESYFYGNFSPDRSRWETVPPTPRYGTHYVGLRHRIAILSESYAYAPFKDRVLASRGFVRAICAYAATNKEAIHKLLSAARDRTVRAGTELKESDRVVLQSKSAPVGRPHPLLGYVEEVKDGRRVRTGQLKTYEVVYWGGAEPTLTVRRPYAYLVPAALGGVVTKLQQHGIKVDELREDIELDVEAYRVDAVRRASEFQKHRTVTLQVTPRQEARRVEAGTLVVRTAQPLGDLVVYLLEPQSADGLATWNFFDIVLAVGKDFPMLRLPAAVPLTTCPARPLPEDRQTGKPLTFDAVYGHGRPLDFNGSPVGESRGRFGRGGGLTWLDDGEHFLQTKDGRLYKVHARTGRPQPFFDPDLLAKAFGALPAVGRERARALVRRPGQNMNPQRTGALFEHDNDLYFATFDGKKAVRLTKTPGREEVASFSPDGRFVAFVRGNNLYVVDVAPQAERALTTDGADLISNGKADWVYFEEVYNRRRQAYWWSPDSRRLAFLRFDDRNVPKFTVVNNVPHRQTVETTPYPRPGEPNPTVKLGVVAVGGGDVNWVDLSSYETASLVVRVGWTPENADVYFYVQDRAQTWLDFCTAPASGGVPKRLFRETTKAWVDDPGPATFLKDGSFLLPSERSGWKHLYHFDPAGKLIRALTEGPWEARTLHHVDEATGWVYFSGTRDTPVGSNLYRVRLDGGGGERLTHGAGEHRASVSPKGGLFLDTWSDHTTPTQVRLFQTDGRLARTVDTNPVYAREEYRFGQWEFVQVPTPDGFLLEGMLLRPADFDPGRRYPVWFMTYAGPHAPTVRDGWAGGHVSDQIKASMGFLVFHCDPRSASGKGACSTWTAYRQLGVQELKDIETAIRWLCSHSFVDPARVGMSGHSYGGFMTAFALTHSKLFAAGIAGAPVTDWRNYDSIYTERYMNTPQENPKGYEATSVVRAAAQLHGKLLLLHGAIDDNVHPQNTYQLVNALQRAGKDFELMIYPQSRHGGFGPHFTRLEYEFMGRVLRPEEPMTSGTLPQEARRRGKR